MNHESSFTVYHGAKDGHILYKFIYGISEKVETALQKRISRTSLTYRFSKLLVQDSFFGL